MHLKQRSWHKIMLASQGNADHTQRRPSQRIRVLRSRRLLIDRPEANERIDLVRKRDGDRDRIGGHAIVGAKRLVVLLARRRDPRNLPPPRGGGLFPEPPPPPGIA